VRPLLSIEVSSVARAQIRDVLAYTLDAFGAPKAREYARLVRLALQRLAENPQAGKARPEIHPDAWTYHIGKPGKRARHMFLYRVRERVQVARFLYDAMDLLQQRPEEWR
jgi:plasmid stabilization system protein ParE